jgi:hypothetical protein
MKANYNVTGAARKALVSAISNITGHIQAHADLRL